MKEAPFTKTFRSAIQNHDIENVSSHRILRSSSFYNSIEKENQHTFCVLLNFGYLHTKKISNEKTKENNGGRDVSTRSGYEQDFDRVNRHEDAFLMTKDKIRDASGYTLSESSLHGSRSKAPEKSL